MAASLRWHVTGGIPIAHTGSVLPRFGLDRTARVTMGTTRPRTRPDVIKGMRDQACRAAYRPARREKSALPRRIQRLLAFD